MPRVILNRARTYEYDGIHFRRGIAREVPSRIYHALIRQGIARDPDQQIDYMNPRNLRQVPPGNQVVVFRDMGLGDVLMVSIPLRDLCARHPGLRFIYAVDRRYVTLFRAKGMPWYQVKAIDDLKGAWRYAIDLRGYSERHGEARRKDRIDIFAEYLLGGRPSSYRFPIRVGEDEIRRGKRLLGQGGRDHDRGPAGPRVGLVLRASMMNRTWGIDYYQRYAVLAERAGLQVVLIDARQRRNAKFPLWRSYFSDAALDLTGRLSIADLRDVVAALDVVLSPDTGVAHLAEACGTPCVAYFTTVPPELRVGYYEKMRVLYPRGQLPCLGCMHSPTCKPKNHPRPDPRDCAKLSTPEMAWEKTLECVPSHREARPVKLCLEVV